jgi:hypothetical protein
MAKMHDAETAELNHDEELEAIEGPIEIVRVNCIGTTMLLMNSNAGVNPLNELVKEKGVLTSKRPKQRTDEDIWEIYRLDFMLGLYFDPEVGPFIPGVNVEAAILESAKIERLGAKFRAGVRVLDDKIPLQYRGPRDPDKLWRAKTFADIRPTKLKATSSLMKCRPCFREWNISFSVSYNGAIIDRAAVERCVLAVGDVGLCDYRKRYGKSKVEIV